MVLADLMFLWIGGALLIGLVGFVVVVLVGLWRAFAFVLRAFLGSGPARSAQGQLGHEPRVCPGARCGFLNRHSASYCARCGQPLAPEQG